LGPSGRTERKTASKELRRQLDVVEVAAPELLKALAQFLADARCGRLGQLPEPACSHSDSTSRIDSPRTNAPITIAFNGSVRKQLRATREQLGLRDLQLKLPLGGLHLPGAKAVAGGRVRRVAWQGAL
jgi:hypothetical protein